MATVWMKAAWHVVFVFINLHRTCAFREFKIGGLFDLTSDHQELAFQLAVRSLTNNNNNITDHPFRLSYVSSRVDIANTLKSSWETCRLMSEGVLGLIGPNSPLSSPYIQAVCDNKEMPHVETHWYSQYERSNGSINVHPHPPVIQQVYLDVVRAWGWRHFTILYEEDEDLFKVEKLLNHDRRQAAFLRKLTVDEDASYRTMLRGIKKSGEDHFVVVCSIGVLQTFLKQAQQVGLTTEKEHYLIYNLDAHTANLEPYQYGGCNITGIRLFDPNRTDVLQVERQLQREIDTSNRFKNASEFRLTTETALTIDAVRVFHNILEYLTMVGLPLERPLHCKSTETKHHGYTITNEIRMRQVRGITGLVQFDNGGFRSNFRVDVVELGANGLSKVGTWSSGDGLRIDRRLAKADSEGDGSIRHQSFTIIIALTNPYAMVKETTHQLYGNDRFEGYGIDLIHELSLMLGFNYTFVVQEDGSNGNFNRQTLKWDGMIGEIVAKRAHLAITDLTITAEREEAVDFTLPFMNLGISILYKKPAPVPPSLFMFLSPFSGAVWMLLGVACLVVSLCLFLMARICPSEWTNPYPCVDEPEFLLNQFSLRNSMWFTVGSLMQQGTEIAPIGMSTRMLAGVWWFFTLIMVSSYTANLAAFLTVETLVTPFKDINELARQTEIGYGAKADGATAYYFRDSSDKEPYKSVWRYMYRHKEMMTQDNDEGVRRVLDENYAFFMESTTIEYVTERQCSLAQVGDLLVEKAYGIAMEKGSKYRSALNAAILSLQETGKLTTLKIKWWKEKRGGGNCVGRSAGAAAKSLSLQNVGGVFLVVGVGVALGVLMTFVELAVHTFRRSYRDNVDFRKEIRDELKFFVRFRTTVKPQHLNN